MNKTKYLRNFIYEKDSFFYKLFMENSKRGDIQPCVEPELGRFLAFMVRLTNAKKILEFGTGNGYSAIWIGDALKDTKGKLISIDDKERLHNEAVTNVKSQDLTDYIDLKLGDAREIVKTIEGEQDIIFQDCGKYLYSILYEDIFKLLRKGGLLIADDTLFKVEKKVRKGLGNYTDEYNKIIFMDKRFYSTIIPIGHGVTLSIKL